MYSSCQVYLGHHKLLQRQYLHDDDALCYSTLVFVVILSIIIIKYVLHSDFDLMYVRRVVFVGTCS
jgi:hypothetical protein